MAFWKPGTTQPPTKTPQKSNDILSSSATGNKSTEKTILSKSVMGMKFMKKKEESIKIEQAEKIKFDKINNISWIADEVAPITDLMDIDDSELTCVKDDADNFSALPGRRSFGGFNKAVEKHYQQMIDHKRFQTSAKADDAKIVSDEEMLLRYENLVGLPRGPSQGVRQEVKANSKSQYNKFSGQAVDSSSGSNGGGNHSKNKSLHLGGGVQHKGAMMEEVVHFEDRTGSGNTNNVKRKGEAGSGAGNNFPKKKFKR
jgi:hypothetical protein